MQSFVVFDLVFILFFFSFYSLSRHLKTVSVYTQNLKMCCTNIECDEEKKIEREQRFRGERERLRQIEGGTLKNVHRWRIIIMATGNFSTVYLLGLRLVNVVYCLLELLIVIDLCLFFLAHFGSFARKWKYNAVIDFLRISRLHA